MGISTYMHIAMITDNFEFNSCLTLFWPRFPSKCFKSLFDKYLSLNFFLSTLVTIESNFPLKATNQFRLCEEHTTQLYFTFFKLMRLSIELRWFNYGTTINGVHNWWIIKSTDKKKHINIKFKFSNWHKTERMLLFSHLQVKSNFCRYED